MNKSCVFNVTLNYVNASPITFDDWFSVPSFTPHGWLIGEVRAYDSDIDQSLSYRIISK